MEAKRTMKTYRGFALVVGIALGVLPAFAQSTPNDQSTPDQSAAVASTIPPDQLATKEQIEKIFEVMRLRKQMEGMMSMMPEVITQTFRDQVKNINDQLPPGKQLTAQDQAGLEKVMKKYVDEAESIYPVDEMIADAVPVYLRHISKADADAVIVFYSSPAGQRLLDEQPAIMKEYMGVVMSHMQTRSKRLTDEMQAEIEQAVKGRTN
jgi:hypothetical protein